MIFIKINSLKIRRIAIIIVTLGVQSKDLQLITAMFSEDKVTEIIYLADEFCNFFDAQQEKSMLEAILCITIAFALFPYNAYFYIC